VRQILITGSEGLVGTHLTQALPTKCYKVKSLDVKFSPFHTNSGNILEMNGLRQAAQGCMGIIHLAAVSRVIWGERDPKQCWQTNVIGTQNVLQVALEQKHRPWVIFASSREVYGQPTKLPANEESQLQPVNIYARSKVAAEQAVNEARIAGLRTAIVRLSNVYGSINDHTDRVVPAFSRGAAMGTPLRVEGDKHTFDFTHISDTISGILGLIEVLVNGENQLPPIHLLTGRPTTLGQLAELANAAGGNSSKMMMAPPRSFDVAHFYGDPSRAKALLGWSAHISIENGVQQLVKAFTASMNKTSNRKTV